MEIPIQLLEDPGTLLAFRSHIFHNGKYSICNVSWRSLFMLTHAIVHCRNRQILLSVSGQTERFGCEKNVFPQKLFSSNSHNGRQLRRQHSQNFIVQVELFLRPLVCPWYFWSGFIHSIPCDMKKPCLWQPENAQHGINENVTIRKCFGQPILVTKCTMSSNPYSSGFLWPIGPKI